MKDPIGVLTGELMDKQYMKWGGKTKDTPMTEEDREYEKAKQEEKDKRKEKMLGNLMSIPGQMGEMVPEMMGLINALTEYPVNSAKFQPKYLPQAPSLNVQPQLNQNYSQTKSLLERNTGSPSIDQANALQAMANLYDANDNVLGQKYNMDSNRKFQVDSANVGIENQANLENLNRLDKVWDKMTQRKAVQEKSMETVMDSAYQKSKMKMYDKRSLDVTNQMLDNYKYDPMTGLQFVPGPNGQLVYMPGMFNPYMNSYDGKTTTKKTKYGNTTITDKEDDSN
jgi:hypothetical protein